MSKSLKSTATVIASEYGFSSLQELVRVLLTKVARRQMVITVQEPVLLSRSAQTRYALMDKDFKSGKNVYLARDVAELKKQLSP